MENRNFKLGIFVFLGILFLTIGLYLIGTRQGFFRSSIIIYANFKDVNGLLPGNNVRYSGINIGTVKSIHISSDSTIEVKMIIEKSSVEFIKDNYLISIGTDGLMGNKLVNIHPLKQSGKVIRNGDTLMTMQSVDTYEMLRTLDLTNQNVNLISANLKSITGQLSSVKGPAWKLLNDSSLSEILSSSMKNLYRTTENAEKITLSISEVINDLKSSSGLLYMINDSNSWKDIPYFLSNLRNISTNTLALSDSLKKISSEIQSGKGTLNALLKDSLMASQLKSIMNNLKNGSEGFNENMEALKNNFLFRSYFKNKAKRK